MLGEKTGLTSKHLNKCPLKQPKMYVRPRTSLRGAHAATTSRTTLHRPPFYGQNPTPFSRPKIKAVFCGGASVGYLSGDRHPEHRLEKQHTQTPPCCNKVKRLHGETPNLNLPRNLGIYIAASSLPFATHFSTSFVLAQNICKRCTHSTSRTLVNRH